MTSGGTESAPPAIGFDFATRNPAIAQTANLDIPPPPSVRSKNGNVKPQSADSQTFWSNAFSDNLLDRLNASRSLEASDSDGESSSCDVEIECKGGKILAHLCIIADQCSAFKVKRQFRNAQTEITQADNAGDKKSTASDNLEKVLNGLASFDVEWVSPIIDFCYTGSIDMTMKNVVHLLRVAECVQVKEDLVKALDTFLLNNLQAISTQSDFIAGMTETNIRRILSGDPRRSARMPIWTIALFQWWIFDKNTRSEAYIDLMEMFSSSDIKSCTRKSIIGPASITAVNQGIEQSQIASPFGTVSSSTSKTPTTEKETGFQFSGPTAPTSSQVFQFSSAVSSSAKGATAAASTSTKPSNSQSSTAVAPASNPKSTIV